MFNPIKIWDFQLKGNRFYEPWSSQNLKPKKGIKRYVRNI